MASQGPLYPGLGSTEVGPSGDNDWLNPNNIGSDNGVEAQITAATFDNGDHSWRLIANNYGFTIPAGATIDGIVVEIDRRAFIGDAADQEVQLRNSSGNAVGTNKASTAGWTLTAGVATYGGAADTWSAGLTADDINSSQFGVHLIARATANNTDIGVDFIRVTVYYTEAGGPTLVTLAATSTLTPSVARTATFLRTLAVASSFSIAFGKSVAKTLAVVSVLGPALLAQQIFLKALSVASAFSPGLDDSLIASRSIAASTSMAAALSKQVNKTLAVASPFIVAMQKHIYVTLAVASVFGAEARKGLAITLAAASSFAAGVGTSYVRLQSLAAASSFSTALASVFQAGGAAVRRLMALLGVGR